MPRDCIYSQAVAASEVLLHGILYRQGYSRISHVVTDRGLLCLDKNSMAVFYVYLSFRSIQVLFTLVLKFAYQIFFNYYSP